MTVNEFVLAFVGIVIGLGVTDLLTSFHKLLRASVRVKWDWLTLLYSVLMLYALIAFWWYQFGYARTGTLTIAAFLLNFAFVAISFLMVASALPDDVPAGGIDLRAYYIASMRHRWGLVTLSLMLNVVMILLYLRSPNWSIALPVVSAILAALAMRVKATLFQVIAILWIFGVTIYSSLFLAIGS